MSRRIRLGESLVEAGLINPAQLDQALARTKTTRERIGEALVALGYITERDLVRTLAKDADIPFLEPDELVVDASVIELVAEDAARSNKFIPLRADGRSLVVALSNPFDIGVIRSLERATGRQIRTVTGDPAVIAKLVETYYGRADAEVESAVAGSRQGWAARLSAATQAPAALNAPPSATAYAGLPSPAQPLLGASDQSASSEPVVVPEGHRHSAWFAMGASRTFAALIDQDGVVLVEYLQEESGFRVLGEHMRRGRIATPGVAADCVIDLLAQVGAKRASVSVVLEHFASGAGVSRSAADAMATRLGEARVRVEAVTIIPEVFRQLYQALDGSTEATAVLICLSNGAHLAFFVNGRLELAIDAPLALEGRAPLDPAVIIDQLERGSIFLRQQARGTVATRLLLAAPVADYEALASVCEERTGMHVAPLGRGIGSPETVVAIGAVLAARGAREAGRSSRTQARRQSGSNATIGRWAVAAGILVAVAAAATWTAVQLTALSRTKADLEKLKAQVERSAVARDSERLIHVSEPAHSPSAPMVATAPESTIVTPTVTSRRDTARLAGTRRGAMVVKHDAVTSAVASVTSKANPAHADSTRLNAGDERKWTVSSILFEDSRRSAIVNNAWVTIGDTLGGGAYLTAIERKHVVVTDANGVRHIVSIPGGDQ